jgi:hypothetical protein
MKNTALGLSRIDDAFIALIKAVHDFDDKNIKECIESAIISLATARVFELDTVKECCEKSED